MTNANPVRYRFTLPPPLAERFEAALGRGASKSGIAAKAIIKWLDSKGDDDLELRFAKRLDVLSNQLSRIERNSHLVIETLAVFIQDMLTVNPDIAEEDEEARSLGRDRFEDFIKRVAHQVAKGRSVFPGGNGE